VTHHWAIQACSAVTGENLLHEMDWIIGNIASRIYLLNKQNNMINIFFIFSIYKNTGSTIIIKCTISATIPIICTKKDKANIGGTVL